MMEKISPAASSWYSWTTTLPMNVEIPSPAVYLARSVMKAEANR